MNVLVCHASRHGATQELANVIAEEIRRTARVDVSPLDRVTDLSGYDAVVIGSAVYLGRWLRPATDFITRLSPELRGRPVWLFSSGPLGGKPDVVVDEARLAQLTALTGAREHRIVGGRLDRADLGLSERAIVRMVGAPDGDFRDLAQARDWAASIAAALREVATAR
jgi:menaquinone-dependent protoporphyrinogen oxidase